MTHYPLYALIALQRAARALQSDENDQTRTAYASALAALTLLDAEVESESAEVVGLMHNFLRSEVAIRGQISLLPGASLVFRHDNFNTTISLYRPQFTDVLLIQGDVNGVGWERAVASVSQSGVLIDSDTLDEYGRFTLRPLGQSEIEIRLKRTDRQVVELPLIALEVSDG